MVKTPRISREEMLIEFAYAASRRGTCDRLHVGAIIAREARPISAGYVGAPSGEPHCSPDLCDVSKPCTRTNHAESNALAFAHEWGIDVEGCDMAVTDSPCLMCARAIVAAGIARVYYDREYRNPDGVIYLRRHGVQVFHVPRNSACAFKVPCV